MGNTCKPVVDSFRYMAKPIQYCKVVKLNLKKLFMEINLSIHTRLTNVFLNNHEKILHTGIYIKANIK